MKGKTTIPRLLPLSKKSVLILGITSLFAVSCEKEASDDISFVPPANDQKSIVYRLDNIPLDRVAKSSMKSDKAAGDNYIYDYALLSTNPDDADDEAINGLLFSLTEAVKELIKDPSFNNTIINMARTSETSTANLLDLRTVAPHFYDRINLNLQSDGLTIQGIADALVHHPLAPNPDFPETADLEHYVPAIFVPNAHTLDIGLQPLLSPNLDVDASDDESLEDNIIAWYYTDPAAPDITEFLIDEHTANGTTNPLFFVDNAVTTLDVPQNPNPVLYHGCDTCIYTDSTSGRNRTKAKGQEPMNYVSSTKSFSSYEHRIKGGSYKYESWTGGKSEFAITAYRIEPNGTHHWIYSGSGHKVINKIKRSHSDNWTWQYKWSHHAANWTPYYNSWNFPTYQSGVNYVFWNTYERDWNRSDKSLGTVSANGTTLYITGRRKYTSEWYAWIPSTLQVHNTQFVWIDYYWAHWNNSWKSDFRLWKVFI